ncbi:MAG TPA: hypothetical protein VFI28_11800 [Candidatus Limnocylindrales bacterium]|nr:hypothetical protein [Candidatus Limnocylindrales bacterium]
MRDPSVVVEGIAGLRRDLGRLLIAVGVFDGLHLGHLRLLETLVSEAARRGARPAVLTFDAHPDAIVRGEAPPLLCDPDERRRRLAAAGVEIVVVVHFDVALRRTPYDQFVRSIADRVDLAGFVMTPDAAFGFERRGTPSALRELGARFEPPFDVVEVSPFSVDGGSVSSSAVRAAIASGDLTTAARLLGRPYVVAGELEASGRVAFPMPVALPPPGAYGVELEPPSSLGTGWAGARAAVIEIDGGVRLSVDGLSTDPGPAGVDPPPPSRRVRLAFGSRDG